MKVKFVPLWINQVWISIKEEVTFILQYSGKQYILVYKYNAMTLEQDKICCVDVCLTYIYMYVLFDKKNRIYVWSS